MRIKTLNALLLFCFISSISYAAFPPPGISGPTSANTGQDRTYTYNRGSILFSPHWNIGPNGVLVSLSQSGTTYTAVVQWSSPGTVTLSITDGGEDGIPLASLLVTVFFSGPANPSTTFSTVTNCGSSVVTRNTNPISTVDWYWQTTTNGTSTANNTNTYTATATGNLYLRARLKASPYTWSLSSQSVGSIQVYTTPVTPVTPNHATVFKNSSATLSVAAVAGTTGYAWYTTSFSVTPIAGATTATYSITTLPDTKTYYVASINGPCQSSGKLAVTATALAHPQVQTSGGASPAIPRGGGSVVLALTETYTTYSWTNSASQQISTAATCTVSQPGLYSVNVTKTGVGGTGISLSFKVGKLLEGSPLNYISTVRPLLPVKDITKLNDLPIDSVMQQVQYFDGLGRPVQTVTVQGSPLKKDIVQPVTYDAFGRVSKNYLPVVINTGDGWYKSGLLDGSGNFAGAALNFYNNSSDKIADDAKPYAETVFESSPLNRVIKQGAPGAAWQPDATHTYSSTDHTVKHAYEFNAAGDVLQWTYTPATAAYPLGLVNAGTAAVPIYVPANELYKNKTRDEHNNEVIEFIDKQGKIILKKVQSGTGQYASTYYIYDLYDQLVCVIPPEAVARLAAEYYQAGATDVTKDAFLGRWAFRYRYDPLRRMILKHVPGTDSVRMVYDNYNRLVLTQDGNQRVTHQWLYTKYDTFNRPVMTGIYAHGSGRTQKQMSALISTVNFFESYDGTASTHGYTNSVFPTTNLTLLTATYYDVYTFKSLTTGLSYINNDYTGQPSVESLRVLGQVTGTKINIVGTAAYLYGVTYYDSDYRMLQTITQNHKSGTDRATNKYDFSGKVLESKRTCVVSGVTRTIKETFAYDHAGRLLTAKHSANGAADVMIVKNEYNELGQLTDKQLHSADNGATFKQSVDYRYNIRGWLTSINNSKLENNSATNNDDNDLFGMELGYTDALGLGSTPQYNGNISAMKWSNNTIQSNVLQRGYAFTYDAMNRLNDAYQKQAIIYGTWIPGSYNEKGITYDLNGNIKKLVRTGENGAQIDSLEYFYGTIASNKLISVTDGRDRTKGFVETNFTQDDYDYDKNGNLTVDKNKGITTITYNHLNLPVQVNKGPSNYIVYTYDATGRKLSQQVFGTGAKTTDYLSEMILENNTLAFINFSEGRILPDGTNWEYQYHLKDHLGNVRTTFTAKEITTAKIATLETANVTAEQGEFLRFAEARKVQSFLFDHTNGSSPSTTTGYAQRLSGSANEKFGLAKSISVMTGDVISAEVYAKYIDTNPSNRTAALNTLLSQIALGTAGAGVVVDGGSLGSSTANFPFPGQAAQNTTGSSEAGPKAYLNWLVFKRDGTFVPAQSGYDRISTTPKETGLDVAHERLYSPTITITEPGFVYIYLSNEESAPIEVYFDDFKVTHVIKAPVVQSDDYYPFGLAFNSYTREDATKNKWKFQGQEHIDDLDLGWDSFKWRNHMPDIGRFFNVDPLSEKYVYNSPYAFAENKVITFIELEGLEGLHYTEKLKNGGTGHVIEKNVVVLTRKTSGEFSEKKNARIERDNTARVDAVRTELNDYYSGATNTAGESVRFQFNVTGKQVENTASAGTSKEQIKMATENGLEGGKPAFDGGPDQIAPAAVITTEVTGQSSTNGISIKVDDTPGATAHEVGHTLMTRPKNQQESRPGSGGLMVDPPSTVTPREVDKFLEDAIQKKN